MSGQDHDQGEPEVGASRDDEFEMRVEEMRERVGDAGGGSPSGPLTSPADIAPVARQGGRFGAARLVVAIVVLAVVIVFALAPGGGLNRLLSSIGLAGGNSLSAYPTPTLALATPAEIGSAPLTCTPSTISSYSNDIGGSPVWVGSFQASMKGQATTYVGHSAYTRYGWRALVVFRLEPGVTDQVVMSGERLSDGSPLWIGVLKPGQTYYDTRATPSVRAVLDPKNPGFPDYEDTGWAAWGGVLYIPAAGCYALDASWPGGSWRVTFAAGL